MDVAEFDLVAEEYLELHAKNVRITGEAPEYFARYKIDEIRRLWSGRSWTDPRVILDFGSGIGASLPHLRRNFPAAHIIASDVSQLSLAISRQRFPDIASFELYDGAGEIADEASVDLAFAICVFHHVGADEHVELMQRLRRTLRSGGALVVFEHNPINPVTQHIVATCPFDKNAVLLGAGKLKARLREAGFRQIESTYTGFFPAPLAPLRRFEPFIGGLPIGAQYYVVAKL